MPAELPPELQPQPAASEFELAKAKAKLLADSIGPTSSFVVLHTTDMGGHYHLEGTARGAVQPMAHFHSEVFELMIKALAAWGQKQASAEKREACVYLCATLALNKAATDDALRILLTSSER